MNDENRTRPQATDIDGVLLLDKPVGISSNRALQRAKRLLGARKAGHTGSLDVLASGLLPICLGEATKLGAFLLDADKTYEAEICLGVVTKTGDREGEILRRVPGVDIARGDAERVLQQFCGEIEQIPPMHSALKRNGQTLYKLAHRGIEIPREPRKLTIHDIALTELRGDHMRIRVRCSKGTYIRTLAEDIGAALGCGAHVSALRRLHHGPYDIDAAYTLADLERMAAAPGSPTLAVRVLMAPDSAIVHLPPVALGEDALRDIVHGRAVRLRVESAGAVVRLYSHSQQFIGVGTVSSDGYVAPRRLMRRVNVAG